jgi:D-alanine-D-alanine ligase
MKATALHKKPKIVAVLMGGWNGEREVSLTSARDCLKAFQDRGFEAVGIEVTQDIPMWVERLIDLSPDVIFMNALHGRWVEDGCLQGLLEMLGFPYTNSGVLASALAMDKRWSRQIFEQAGLPIPKGKVLSLEEIRNPEILPYPFVMKPVNQGSSIGVSIIHGPEDFETAQKNWVYGQHVLIEDYIPGKEISVAVMGNKALGVLELQPKKEFYDYEAKYTEGKTEHFMPARLSEEDYKYALELSLKATKALGCDGVSRVDLRYDNIRQTPSQMYVLEVNTQAGMTPLSILPEIAAHCNISFADLLEWMIHNPICPEENQIIRSRAKITTDERVLAVRGPAVLSAQGA